MFRKIEDGEEGRNVALEAVPSCNFLFQQITSKYKVQIKQLSNRKKVIVLFRVTQWAVMAEYKLTFIILALPLLTFKHMPILSSYRPLCSSFTLVGFPNSIFLLSVLLHS